MTRADREKVLAELADGVAEAMAHDQDFQRRYIIDSEGWRDLGDAELAALFEERTGMTVREFVT